MNKQKQENTWLLQPGHRVYKPTRWQLFKFKWKFKWQLLMAFIRPKRRRADKKPQYEQITPHEGVWYILRDEDDGYPLTPEWSHRVVTKSKDNNA